MIPLVPAREQDVFVFLARLRQSAQETDDIAPHASLKRGRHHGIDADLHGLMPGENMLQSGASIGLLPAHPRSFAPETRAVLVADECGGAHSRESQIPGG